MKKFPRTSDKRNAAGGLCEVERTVRTGGNIVFDGSTWHHRLLSNLKGERVTIKDAADSAFATGPIEVFYKDPYHPFVQIDKPNPDCPDCGTGHSLHFEHTINTERHGILSYFHCNCCKERYVRRNGRELSIAAPIR